MTTTNKNYQRFYEQLYDKARTLSLVGLATIAAYTGALSFDSALQREQLRAHRASAQLNMANGNYIGAYQEIGLAIDGRAILRKDPRDLQLRSSIASPAYAELTDKVAIAEQSGKIAIDLDRVITWQTLLGKIDMIDKVHRRVFIADAYAILANMAVQAKMSDRAMKADYSKAYDVLMATSYDQVKHAEINNLRYSCKADMLNDAAWIARNKLSDEGKARSAATMAFDAYRQDKNNTEAAIIAATYLIRDSD